MSDPDAMDRLLRRSLNTESAPTLSPEFERRLATRLRPRRLSPKSRGFLLGYSFLGFSLSLGTMHASGMDWRMVGLAVVVPLIITAAIIRPLFRSRAEKRSR